ncbi:geranylgeranyl transferase type beta subunit like protein [Babesia gibsoni]|uniref:Geranylgeranyl transferase type II subunit beta n=1 Tax=Babesia gibsoni TaxID=33632 RepID=A0AAD8P7M8_BABGI|nr:geranylgeranyl transferase type beta subunit like protein [Babesia gibsoni]
MYEKRRDKILRKLHGYFKHFYKKGLIFIQDTEMMSRDMLECRASHEGSLLKGMYWSMFSLHHLDEMFKEASPDGIPRDLVTEDRPYPVAMRLPEESDEEMTQIGNNDYLEDTDTSSWDSETAARAIDCELQRLCSRSVYGSELDTDVLNTREVDTVLRFLKTCMRDFVHDDVMFMGFANSDDRRRFYPNVTSTYLALSTYRLIGESLKMKVSIWFAKHMSWVYEVDELLAFIRMLYQHKKGYYRKCLFPVLPESADIRHTASAVLSTSIALRLAGCDDEYYYMKMKQWIDVDDVTKHVIEHFNEDGGVSLWPPAESHCGAAFCAVAILTVLGTMDRVPREKLVALKGWLMKTLAQFGGVSGRTGKAEDVCYSFWLLGSLSLLRRFGIQSQVLRYREMLRFIEKCQAPSGGLSPYPSNGSDSVQADPFHSFAGLMAITLIEEERMGSETSILDRLI